MSRFVFWFQTRNRINRHALTCGTDQVSNCWSHSKCHASHAAFWGKRPCQQRLVLAVWQRRCRHSKVLVCSPAQRHQTWFYLPRLPGWILSRFAQVSQSNTMFYVHKVHVCSLSSGSSVQPLVQRRQCSDLVARLRRTLRPPERCETLSCWTAGQPLDLPKKCWLSMSAARADSCVFLQRNMKDVTKDVAKQCKPYIFACQKITHHETCHKTWQNVTKHFTNPGPGSRCLRHPVPRIEPRDRCFPMVPHGSPVDDVPKVNAGHRRTQIKKHQWSHQYHVIQNLICCVMTCYTLKR